MLKSMATIDPLQMLKAECKKSSQSKVAKRLGVSRQFICDVLKGRRDITDRLLEGLGVEKRVTYRSLRTQNANV
jgi:plasmid maintenance system antidote protein VapI